MAKNKKTVSSTGGESSLRTLVAQLKQESIDNGDLIVASNFILSNISNNIADMTEHILKMPVIMATATAPAPLVAKEKDAENLKETEKDNKREDKISTTLDNSLTELKELRKDLKKGGLLDLLLAGAAILGGSVLGIAQQYLNVFSKIFKPVLQLFEGDGKTWGKMMDRVRDGWKSFTSLFTKLGNWFMEGKTGSVINKGIEIFKSIGNMFGKVVEYFKSVGNLIAEAWAGINAVFGSKEGGFIGKIVNFFKGIGDKFKYFFKLGVQIGKKILFPIITLYDTIMGALEGYEKEGVFGAIKGAIAGFINSIIGGLLDLVKDGVSWLLNLLGFENASKFLDSFSFQELIEKAVDGFFNFVKGMFDFVVDVFTNPGKAMEKLAEMGNMASEGLKKLLRTLLPNPAGGTAEKIASKLIPDSVYEFAGMDPKTGAVVQQTADTGVATKALQGTTNENTAVKAEAAAKTAMAGAAASMSNSSSQVVNNNTTQAAIIRSKATNWDPEDQWARGLAYGA